MKRKQGFYEKYIKRGVDIILSFGGLVVLSPILAGIAIAIKIDDPGPVLFTQKRMGQNKRYFELHKFRSMKMCTPHDKPTHMLENPEQYITKVGKFLREHHLDELPQLWNVLIGDMAFIGPRPERKYYIDQIMEHDPRYRYLYQIRPGVTSYATLYNGYTDTMEKMLRRLELDLYYLEHRSWWFDFKILAKTFINIVFGKKF